MSTLTGEETESSSESEIEGRECGKSMGGHGIALSDGSTSLSSEDEVADAKDNFASSTKVESLTSENREGLLIEAEQEKECEHQNAVKHSYSESDDITATAALLEIGAVRPKTALSQESHSPNSVSNFSETTSKNQNTASNSSTKSVGSSTKRPYGQVTKLKNGKWKCFDGTEFDMSYKAYRHLKNLRERALQEQSTQSAQKARRSKRKYSSDVEEAEELVCELYGKEINLSVFGDDAPLYEICHQWWVYEGTNKRKLESSTSTPKAKIDETKAYQSSLNVDESVDMSQLDQIMKASVAPVRNTWDAKRNLDAILSQANAPRNEEVYETWNSGLLLKEHVKKWKRSKAM